MFRKFFVNPILNFWNYVTGSIDPYAGYTSQGRAAIYSNLASKNLEEAFNAMKKLPENLEGINIKKIAAGGAVFAGCVAVGAIAPSSTLCAAAGKLGHLAFANPALSLITTTHLTCPKETKGLWDIPFYSSKAAVNGLKIGYLGAQGLYNNDKGPISDDVKELSSIDVEGYVNVINEPPLTGETHDLDLSWILSN